MKMKNKYTTISAVLLFVIIVASSTGTANIFLDPGGPGGGGDPLEYYTGIVRDQFNRKVDDALVRLFENGVVVDSDRTDSVGYYMINYQTSSYKIYTLKVTKTGYDAKTVSVPAETTTKNIYLIYHISTVITGYVYYIEDGEEVSLENANVTLWDTDRFNEDGDFEFILETKTNHVGRYIFSTNNIVDYTYRLDAEHEGYTIRSKDVYIGKTSSTIYEDMEMTIDEYIFANYFEGRDTLNPDRPDSYLTVGFFFKVYQSQKVEFSAAYCYTTPLGDMHFWALSVIVIPSEADYVSHDYFMTDSEKQANDIWNCAGPATLYGSFDDHAWLDGCAFLRIAGVMSYTIDYTRLFAKFELGMHLDGNALIASLEVQFDDSVTSLWDIDWDPPRLEEWE